VVVVECVEHLREGLVQARVRLVHARRLGVVRDGLVTHLLVVLLHSGRVAHVHDVRVVRVAHGTCNLPFLNSSWLWFLRI